MQQDSFGACALDDGRKRPATANRLVDASVQPVPPCVFVQQAGRFSLAARRWCRLDAHKAAQQLEANAYR
jgi:hypothetical protein